MSSAAVAELDAALQGMLALKPPGASNSRVTSITSLCTANVQSESVLVQKLYTHFKKAPGTHKLGVLYVVDSVTRKWMEQAKNAGQPINSAAQDGTFAAGVYRVTELLPVLMNDITTSAPDAQKERIQKLVDIWEKGETFPLQMLNTFREKLNAQPMASSTTPPGSPPPDLQVRLGLQSAPAPAPVAPSTLSTSAILESLANMARQNNPAPVSNTTPQIVDSSYNMSSAQMNSAQPAALSHQTLPYPPVPPPVNVPAAAFASHSQGPSNGVQNQNYTSSQSMQTPFAATTAPPPVLDANMAQQLLLIKALSAQGIPPDQIAGILASMGNQGPPLLGAGGFPPPPPQAYPNANQNQAPQNGWSARPEDSRDHNGYHEAPVRSPQGRYNRRSRSRSPVQGWNAHDSPASRRREEQSYEYNRGSPMHNRGDDDRGRGQGNNYRQRSPPRRGHSPTPPQSGEKWIEFDETMEPGAIKVLSRTLFVGGVTVPEQELRNIFSQFGQVQTCIVNKEKRHAFVKMISRVDAIAAKDAMEKNRAPDSSLRTRWGVGFGPRECSDYATGVSVIPINKLTDADRKWMLNAEYGGSGGKPIVSQMVVEEPDIEIGQGVSSKAISRRMQTDKSGNSGPKSTRDRDEEGGKNRRGNSRDDYQDNHRGNNRRDRGHNHISAPPSMPAVPPFGMGSFPFGMANGMPVFPPGFFVQAQGQNQAQAPPGRRS